MRDEYEIAMDVLRGARDDAQALGDTWGLGLFDLAEADILERQGELGTACAVLERAIAYAREQPSKGVELRAATSLARLWQGQGRGKDAHDLLSPLHRWFTEAFDTQELKEARALLKELA
jgi:predicted ATPase